MRYDAKQTCTGISKTSGRLKDKAVVKFITKKKKKKINRRLTLKAN